MEEKAKHRGSANGVSRPGRLERLPALKLAARLRIRRAEKLRALGSHLGHTFMRLCEPEVPGGGVALKLHDTEDPSAPWD